MDVAQKAAKLKWDWAGHVCRMQDDLWAKLTTDWVLTISAANTRIKTVSAKQFPHDFIFGVATAAYQIEGAWDVDGKGPSIWDYLVHTDPDHITDKSNGDIAANSYYNYKRDIEMLKELGVTHYRFSISWTRILPFGRANYVNQRGIDYYNQFIDELLANDIAPFATIYHWDLPQILQEHGGWLNEKMVDWFGDYARIVFQNFGDRVKLWMTLNEPFVHCYFSYGYGVHAPKIRSPGVGFYECGRQILLANARAYHIYNDEFRSTQGGKVGIGLNCEHVFPASDSKNDIEGAKDYLAIHFGQYMHPIFSKSGNYPQRLIHRVQAASTAQGLNSSRLRGFNQDQITYIKGSADFLGLNHYYTKYVYRNSSVIGMFEVPSMDDDAFADSYLDQSWPRSHAPWIRVSEIEYGPGLHYLLAHIKVTYDNPLVYITENGVSTTAGLNDHTRVSYYRSYLSAVLDALAEGCNVQGYFAWSLMDNYEWASGYTQRFGLYEVDWEDPNRTRTPRKSAFVYREIIRSRMIDYDYDPDPYAGGARAVTSSLLVLLIVVLTVLYS
ncbi:myrosinase 1-like [Cydia splendana]|uniref:myrosinase 1-like n=1 Tax=Cydia splendana TaxID=1100963 RepID=UPI00300D8900